MAIDNKQDFLILKTPLPSKSFKYKDVDDLFGNAVVELHFRRRNYKRFASYTRFMLATTSVKFLNSIPAKAAFHFVPPTKGNAAYNADAYQLKTVYDLIWQDWRNINLRDFQIQGYIPVRTDPEMNYFWLFFRDVLSKLGGYDKVRYTNRGSY